MIKTDYLFKIYCVFPVFLQNIFISIYGAVISLLRYNPIFWYTFYQAINVNKHFSDVDSGLEAKKFSGFKKVVASLHSFPFLQDASGDIFELGNYRITDKEFVNEYLRKHNVLRRRFRVFSRVGKTSGSTGAGLKFIEPRTFDAFRWAIWWRFRLGVGLTFNQKCGYFGGRSFVPLSANASIFWRHSLFSNQILFSIYHLSEGNVDSYIKKIVNSGVQWLHGYPSALCELARLVDERRGLGFVKIALITTGSETLTESQRQYLSRVFGANVYQMYGQSEGVANISECPRSRLHIDEDFSIVELLPTDTRGLFRIIGTNYKNWMTPFIRYDTGDLVRYSKAKCSCGRSGRVVDEVVGRDDDYIVLADGTRVGRLDHVTKGLSEVIGAQFVQRVKGEVKVILHGTIDESTLREINTRLYRFFDKRLVWEIIIGEKFLINSSGKYKMSVRRFD